MEEFYNNIIFEKEHYGFLLKAEDENTEVNLSVDLSNGGLCNLVRKIFRRKPKLKISGETLELKDKKTGTLTEVFDFKDGKIPVKYVNGEVMMEGEGEDLLMDARERLHFKSYKRHYEQLFK